jgi:hypothetical protein
MIITGGSLTASKALSTFRIEGSAANLTPIKLGAPSEKLKQFQEQVNNIK